MTDAFVAPAWLYGRGTIEALSSLGFRYAENRFRSWDPMTGRTILHSPVMNFAGGSGLKQASAAAWVHSAMILMRGAGTVRFALHPSDLARRESVMKVLGALLTYRSSAPIHTARQPERC